MRVRRAEIGGSARRWVRVSVCPIARCARFNINLKLCYQFDENRPLLPKELTEIPGQVVSNREATAMPTVKLSNFPSSARERVRDDLQAIRMQMAALGLEEADFELKRAIVAVCAGLDIPTCLSAQDLIDAS